MSYWHLGPMKGTGGRMSVYIWDDGSVFIPDIEYETRVYRHQGMVAPVPPGMKSRNQTEREMNERMRVQAVGMQNQPCPPEPTVGDLRTGAAERMGVPCALPSPGWRERVRQWRRR